MKRRDNAVKRAVRAAGMTQTTLAQKMCYSKGMISALASGRFVPRLDTAFKLCWALGVDNPHELFDDGGRPRP